MSHVEAYSGRRIEVEQLTVQDLKDARKAAAVGETLAEYRANELADASERRVGDMTVSELRRLLIEVSKKMRTRK